MTDTVDVRQARRIYDRWGARYDWAERFESKAKDRVFDLLDPRPGMHILELGPGTGRLLTRIRGAVAPSGLAVGADLSPVMARLAHERSGAPTVIADGRRLPFADGVFDGAASCFVLDLIPASDLPQVLGELHRVLRPGGRLATATLTEGVGMASRALVAAWKAAFAVSPTLCGGCRPLRNAERARQVGFRDVHTETVVQLAVPSEVLVATA